MSVFLDLAADMETALGAAKSLSAGIVEAARATSEAMAEMNRVADAVEKVNNAVGRSTTTSGTIAVGPAQDEIGSSLSDVARDLNQHAGRT